MARHEVPGGGRKEEGLTQKAGAETSPGGSRACRLVLWGLAVECWRGPQRLEVGRWSVRSWTGQGLGEVTDKSHRLERSRWLWIGVPSLQKVLKSYPVFANGTLRRNRVFADNQAKMRSWGWPLIQ